MVMGTEIIKPKYHNISLSVLKENPVENQKRRVAMVRDRGLTAVGRRTEKETLGVVGEGGGRISTSQSKNRNGCENTTMARRKDRLT